MKIEHRRKKKDFKLRESIVIEFERLAPSGKQTAIIEGLMSDWISSQRREETKTAVRKAYARRGKGL